MASVLTPRRTRSSFTYREDCPCGCGENAEGTVSYTMSPAEQATSDYPGSPAEVSIDEVPELTSQECGTTWTPTDEAVREAAVADADERADP